jgi:NAD(P)-dependent dehydrogenase (short-subunit alcohol dehydrogenase family)
MTDGAAVAASTLLAAAPSALVTGGSRGIGYGIAACLVRRGWSVTLTARREMQLDDAAAALSEGGGAVHTVAADMADSAAVDAALDSHVERFGGLTGLVLAAGVGSAAPVAGYPIHRFDKQFAVNIRAPYALTSRALPLLRESASRGGPRPQIIAIASIEGMHPDRNLSAYGASKSALISLMQSINIEENEHSVVATAISPAYVDTELSAWTNDTVPAHTMIRVEDVVRVVELVLDLSPYAVIPHVVVNRMGAGPHHA